MTTINILSAKTYQVLILFISLLFIGVSSNLYADDLKVSLEELHKKQSAGEEPLIIDVRSKEEFDNGHVPGAVNIPHTEVDQIYFLLNASKDKQKIVYCRSGRRAGLVLEAMKSRDLNDIYHLEGDMNGWSAAGLPIEK